MESKIAQAIELINGGRRIEAIALLEAVLRQVSGHGFAAYVLGQTLLMENRHEKALVRLIEARRAGLCGPDLSFKRNVSMTLRHRGELI